MMGRNPPARPAASPARPGKPSYALPDPRIPAVYLGRQEIADLQVVRSAAALALAGGSIAGSMEGRLMEAMERITGLIAHVSKG